MNTLINLLGALFLLLFLAFCLSLAIIAIVLIIVILNYEKGEKEKLKGCNFFDKKIERENKEEEEKIL